MKYPEYESAFSAARLNKYVIACGGNTTKALILYRHNVKLCQKFYGMLNVFEVTLRNAINEHYKSYFKDPDWIRTQLATGRMLSQHPQKSIAKKPFRFSVRSADRAFRDASPQITDGKKSCRSGNPVQRKSSCHPHDIR